MFRWLSRFFRELESEANQPLHFRLLRLMCATVCALCLLVILPANLLQHLPIWVNAAVFLLGLTAGYCYWECTKDRRHFMAFFLVLMALVNLIWFFNGGSEGSIAYFFFPILLYPLTIFQGRKRWIMATLLMLNLCALLVLDYFFPALSTPFKNPSDRLIDLLASVICGFAAMTAAVWLILNTNERKQKRIIHYTEEVAAAARNYREIFNAASDALFIHDTTGRLVDVNERVRTMFGYDRAGALSLSIGDLSLGTSPYSQAEAMQHIRRAIEVGPQVFRWHSRRQNGDLFWSEIAVRAGEIAGHKRVIFAVRDIGDRVQADLALHLSEERLRLSLDASQQAWFDLNLVTGEGTISEQYPRMLGLEAANFKVTTQGWIENLHPEDREMTLQAFHDCVASDSTGVMEYRRKAYPDGWKWIRSVARIVERDASGRPLRMAGTHADITERKELEARLLHSQRLESIGTIAGGVAHDLNNILTPMLMASSLLESKLSDPADRQLMSLLEDGAKRGAAIVRQLLTFSSNHPSTRVPIDSGQTIREIMSIMASTFPPGIKLVGQLPAGIWPVNADSAQLYQVLLNLCSNARDAMPNGGTLTISVENTTLPVTTGVSRHPWSKGGRFVLIAVRDTGHGIPAAILDRIFDPYFTTKEIGQGSGLGLATVHGIVTDHGGTIKVESAPNQGACFKVFLPAAETTPAANTAAR